jgi:hypothetical protein
MFGAAQREKEVLGRFDQSNALRGVAQLDVLDGSIVERRHRLKSGNASA